MKRGGVWQSQLELRHNGPGGYRDLGLGWVTEAHPAMKVVRGTPIYAAKGPPDFLGVIGQPGATSRAVVFDAKSTEDDAWPFALLEHHQAQDLHAAMDRGALSFLAIKTRRGPYLLMWEHLEDRWWTWWQTYRKGDRKPVPKLDPDTEGYMYPIAHETDWLETMSQWGLWER